MATVYPSQPLNSWKKHEQVLEELEDAQEPSTDRPAIAAHPASASTDAAQMLTDLERKKVKLLESNNFMVKLFVGLCLGSFLIAIMSLIFSEDPSSGKIGAGSPFEIRTSQECRESFSTIVGLESVKSMLRRIFSEVKIPGAKPSRSLLIFGPPGCGKTAIVEAVAKEFGLALIKVSSADIMNSYIGRSAMNTRKAFEEAMRSSPSILMFDEADALLCDRGTLGNDPGGQESTRTISEFLTMCDEILKGPQRVYVVLVTNYPEKLDRAVFRRMGGKILIPEPPYETRRAIFAKLYPHFKKAELDLLADITHGYAASDLDIISRKVGELVIDDMFQRNWNMNRPIVPGFKTVRKACEQTPSTISPRQSRSLHEYAKQHGGAIEKPDRPRHAPRPPGSIALDAEAQAMADGLEVPGPNFPRLEDLFGLDNTINELKIMLHDVATEKKTGSVLLYGPPGTGKTTIGRALTRYANEIYGKAGDSPWQILEVRIPDIFSKYQGESEKKINAIFDVAESKQPCVIFLDEFDGLFTSGNTGEAAGGASDRQAASDPKVRSTFLSRLGDLITAPPGGYEVLIIATTNYPEKLDGATVRRMRSKLYVPLPNQSARKSIFAKMLNPSDAKYYPDSTLEEFAKSTLGWTAADIRDTVDKAKTNMKILAANGQVPADWKTVSLNEMLAVLREHKPHTDPSDVKRGHEWDQGKMCDVEEQKYLNKIYSWFERNVFGSSPQAVH